MKKILLLCLLAISSSIFCYAQFQVGNTRVNVGQVGGTVGGQQVIVNPTTGQIQVGGVSARVGNGGFSIGSVGGRIQGGISVGGVGYGSTCLNQGGVLGLLGLAQCIVVKLVPFLIGVALLAFFWFLIEFIWKGRNSGDEQAKGKAGLFYSILALFIMVSIWGIIALLGTTFGISQGGSIPGFKLPGEK